MERLSKYWIICLLITVAVLFSAQSAQSALTGCVSVGDTLKTTSRTNMRSGPGNSYSIVRSVPRNGLTNAVDACPSNSWYRVSYSGSTGWLNGSVLVLANPCLPESDSTFCDRYGKDCGSFTAADNCAASRTANCGACASPLTCGGDGVPSVCASGAATSALRWAGVRSSNYGISPFPDEAEWNAAIDTMTSYFPGSSPAATIWLVGEVDYANKGMILEFPKPNDGKTYSALYQFQATDKHEPFLASFDASGAKVYLQIEPGDADIPTLIDLVLSRYKNHPSVIGLAIDAEWIHKTSDTGTETPITDAQAIAWERQVKAYNPNYRLLLKHFRIANLPPAYRGDIVFACDSQQFASFDAFRSAMKQFSDKFYPNNVVFQYGYPADKVWWQNLSSPIPKTIGEGLIPQTRQAFGVAWVDFTLRDPLIQLIPPTACTAETDAAFCARLGKNCGSVTAADNCGASRTATCGSCASPQTCGGGGQANICGLGNPKLTGGTGYMYYAMSSATANQTRAQRNWVNDGNITTSILFPSAVIANEWQGLGIIYPAAKTITQVRYFNGPDDGNNDGWFEANMKLQFSVDGNAWTDSGWTVSPAYSYTISACNKAYTFTGPAAAGKVAARVVGQVRVTGKAISWQIEAQELEIYGQ